MRTIDVKQRIIELAFLHKRTGVRAEALSRRDDFLRYL